MTIGGNAFSGCSALTGVIFEKDSALTTINGYVFADCTSLKQITIPKSVTTIGWDILKSCTSLTTVTFEEGSTIEKIGASMFYGCTSLTSIVMPSEVTSIGSSAFYGCTALSKIYYKGTAEDWAKISISSDGEGNACLTADNIYYYSENAPTETGNYWRYENGVPTAWIVEED